MNGLGIFFADDGILPGQFGVAGKRFIDAARIARVQRAGRMEWQQHFDFAGFLISRFPLPPSGQPRRPGAAFAFGQFLRR
jgi:hypothetical protein